jgi:hypothetical protein
VLSLACAKVLRQEEASLSKLKFTAAEGQYWRGKDKMEEKERNIHNNHWQRDVKESGNQAEGSPTWFIEDDQVHIQPFWTSVTEAVKRNHSQMTCFLSLSWKNLIQSNFPD